VSSGNLRGVTFDWWGTLYRHRDTSPARVGLIRQAAVAIGREVSEEAVAAAYSDAAAAFDREWRAGRVYTTAAWLDGILADLGLGLPVADRAALLAALEEAMLGQPPAMVAGARDLLHELHAAGVRLGLISDTGLTVGRVMRKILAADDVLHCFQGLAFSDEVGTVKPARRPYEAALSAMGVAPDQAIHVGDLPFTDICGAKAMGMRAVLITGVSGLRDDGLADAVVEDYAGLRRLFGKWSLLTSN